MSFLSPLRPFRAHPVSVLAVVVLGTTLAAAAPPPPVAPTPNVPLLPKPNVALGASTFPLRLGPQPLVADASAYVELSGINAFKPKDGVLTLKPSIGAPADPSAPRGPLTPPNVFIPGGAVDLYFATGLGMRLRVECQVSGPGRFIVVQGSRASVVEATSGKITYTAQDLPTGPGKKITLYGQSSDATQRGDWTWGGCEITRAE